MNRAALRSMQHVYLITLQPLLSDYHTSYIIITLLFACIMQTLYKLFMQVKSRLYAKNKQTNKKQEHINKKAVLFFH